MSERFDAQAKSLLLERLKVIEPTDPLWVGLLALVEANADNDSDSLCAPRMGDEGAHYARGRLSALKDLRQQLKEVMEEAHAPG